MEGQQPCTADATRLDASSQGAASAVPWSNVRVLLPPDTAGPSRASESLPPPQEDDAKPTPAELKQAFASHIEQRHGPDAPLMTQAMREREAARLGLRKKEHNESRIRIRFSDRTQLEATVPAAAQVPVLYHLLRSHLATEHAQTSFTLYQTPPKRDFPERTKDPKLRGKTLKELGMVPQAALNIRWEKAEMNSNTFPAPLDAQHKAKAEELPPPPTFDGVAPSANDQNTVTAASSGKAEGEPKKMPKWLKGLQKK